MESKNKTSSLKNKITYDPLVRTKTGKESYLKLLRNTKFDDVDKLMPKDLEDSLKRAKENPTEPFAFLTKIPIEDTIEGNTLTKTKNESTEIDIKLANLMKRIELNKILLEKTNQRVRDIDYLVKRSELILPKNQIYDENIYMKIKSTGKKESMKVESSIEYPEIEKFRRTMDATKDMLNYVKKISKGEMTLDDLPEELLNLIKSSKESNEDIKIDQL
ncbi:uncharacterized protein LOC124955687 isoform X1 [Vespa velutina]|uniref:uncharacterized protein LOC124955687 isoform X1 n=2 Tax=Vespa velutina TaxID=202808 RepID=UPI001FB43226|nr:uncharacterized protein LOC124955687 isoform X1 [Vespa velutina]XP_047366443.1 uncharacterized protein LOC124955687 isoform X1 [Vespa velutina]XP_047366445.1 uncharacterized protein LOC124955687 isoform X1 [Vespa velutina]XP_047366446.1 uncharacterized protein LOC124955687 isoform X1 [Vespa velutina]